MYNKMLYEYSNLYELIKEDKNEINALEECILNDFGMSKKVIKKIFDGKIPIESVKWQYIFKYEIKTVEKVKERFVYWIYENNINWESELNEGFTKYIMKDTCINKNVEKCEKHLICVKYLTEMKKKNCTSNAMYNAIDSGNMCMLKYLMEMRKMDCGKYMMNYVIKYGRLEMLKYLLEVRKKCCNEYVINMAIENGDLEMVRYLTEVCKKDYTMDAIYMACVNNHLPLVKYLIKMKNKDSTKDEIDWVSENCRPEVLKYLCEEQLRIYKDVRNIECEWE